MAYTNGYKPKTKLPAVPPRTTALSVEEKHAIATYIQQQAKLLRYCYSQVEAEFAGVENISLRELATTLYIQASKHFGL